MLNKVITTNQKLDAEYQALNLKEPDQLTLETLIRLTRRLNSISGATEAIQAKALERLGLGKL